jgi:RND family efflux transporter MFP subunit
LQFPVEVVPIEARDVEYAVNAVGSVEAFEIVQVTARVPGVVEKVRFAEGDVVRPDQVLVEIDPERYRLARESASAALEKAEAAKADAEAGLARREGAVVKNPGLIPGEELETWRTRVRTATAEVSQARAALDQATLNMRDALATAPGGGNIQTRSVQTGQYVQVGTTLATLVRLNPILLRFQVPEQEASRMRTGMQARFKVRESPNAYTARITSVAESADKNSRMVAVIARVDKGQGEPPRPGTFAEVTIAVGGASRAPVIPQTAVRPSERGFLAYVVQGGVAHERVLSLGLRTSEGLVEVRDGVQPGESLVVRGAEALREGVQVRISSGGTSPGSGRGAGGPPAGGPSAAPDPAGGKP